MFSGLPQATKSRTFSVERDKDSHTLCNCHTDVRLDFRRLPGPVFDPPRMSAGSFSRTAAGNRAYTDVDANLSGSSSTVDISNNCLRIHWLKSAP